VLGGAGITSAFMTAYRVAGALGVVEEGAYFAAEMASGMPLPRRWDFAPDRGIGDFNDPNFMGPRLAPDRGIGDFNDPNFMGPRLAPNPDDTSQLYSIQNAGGASPWTKDLSIVTGSTAQARNKAINAVIKADLFNLNLTFKPEYSPFAAQGVAKQGVGTQIGKKVFGSRDKLIDTIVYEELHHRWWKRGVEGFHHSPDRYVPDEKFYNVLDRYKQMRQYYRDKNGD
jgi:hypothetical protein